MGTEVELKLVTSKSGLRKALSLPWLKQMAGDKISTQHLVSVYFDTRDFALRDRGVSLRVRRTGGQLVQTIKTSSPVPMARGEWEAEIDRERPRLELARRTALAPVLTAGIARHLKPVFETHMERTVIPLHVGHSDIELALDEGRVGTQDSGIDLAEIEIELKRGERGDVARLARKLAHAVPVALSARAKAEWGYALLEGTINAPALAGKVALSPQASSADAFVVIGLACLRQVAGNTLAVDHGDGEGIHQMRVGLRRLRAAMSLFKEMLEGRETERIKSELKWLTAQLGPARDTDVFVSETVAPYLKRHPHDGEFAALAHDLERARSAGFARARAAVEGDRSRRILLDCALWLLDGDWRNDKDALKRAMRERPAAAFAQDELARRGRKIIKRVRRLERLDAMGRHKLRIAVKKLRYGREFFKSLDRGRGKAGRKVDRALKGLQGALGSLNDMRVHMERARELARANGASRKAFAVGYLAGCEEARAQDVLAEALAAGKRLKKAA